VFIPNLPVTRLEFFDREADLERIERAIDKLARGAPQWLCIIGNRRVGKTSLLLEAARRVREDDGKRLGFVVVDVMESAPVSAEVLRTLALAALDAVIAPELGGSLRALAPQRAEYVAAVTGTKAFQKLDAGWRQSVIALPELKPSSAAFAKTCLELPEALAAATQVRLLVAIDEFQELASLSLPQAAPMALMRSIWQRHRHVGYVVSGSSRSMLLELATSRASPFFQHFEVMQLEPFGEADATRLLTESSRDATRISDALARRVFAAVGGHPFYLQVVGEALSRRPRGSDERALRETLQEVLFSRTGTLSLYFEREYQRLVGRATTLAAALDHLASGPARMADVARGIGAATGPTLGYLHRLGDAVVKQDDGRYALADPVFGLWLRWRQPGGTVVPMSVVGDEAELAVARQLAQMGFQTVYQSRGSRGAFDLLALRGPTRLAVQVKRRPVPLRFSRSEWQRMQADGKALQWSWIVASVAKDGAVTFLDPSKVRTLTLGPAAAISNLLAWLEP
jgi:hypothetical protein